MKTLSALLLALAQITCPLIGSDTLARWDFTDATDLTPLAAIPASGPRPVSFQSPPDGYSVHAGSLRLAASGEHETYTPLLSLQPATYILELDLAQWEIATGRHTVHFGFTANLNKVVSADLTVEIGPEGLRAHGRALGAGARNTPVFSLPAPVFTLPATGRDATLRLIVDFASREMELLHRLGSDTNAPFISSGKGTLSPGRSPSAIRLRSTGPLGRDSIGIRSLSVLTP